MGEISKRVITPICRLSFPALFKPAKPMKEGDDPKYQCELLFPGDTDLSELKAAALQAVEDKWGNKVPKAVDVERPFRPGSDRNGTDGYEGCIFMCPRSKDKPGVVVGPRREPCMDPSEVYGGCYVRVSVTAFTYDVGVNKGVSFALNNVWKIRDGESFVGRRAADEEFDEADDMDDEAFGDATGEEVADSLL